MSDMQFCVCIDNFPELHLISVTFFNMENGTNVGGMNGKERIRQEKKKR
jgi:hypothetical protein